MRAAVYTAIAGGYDDLKPHPEIPGVDFIAWTDDGEPADGWDVRAIEQFGVGPHPRDVAKFYKLFPHVVLEEYDFTVWIDGSHEVLSETFVFDCMAATQGAGIAVYDHPWRQCIYDEAVASLDLQKYQGLPIDEQVDAYRVEGHPEKWGLWALGTIARAKSPEVAALMSAWWAELGRWTYQDQLSFPVVCRRLGMRPDTFPCHQVHGNTWTAIRPHYRED